MNNNSLLLYNDFENFNNNLSFNIFPHEKQLDLDYQKEFIFNKAFQEKSDYFSINPKFNSEQIIDSSLLVSTQELFPSQNKNFSFLNVSNFDEIPKETKISHKNTHLFFTEVNNDNDNAFPKKFGDKLLMNRLSARKSRLKKKQYIKNLEEETARLKNQIILNEKTNPDIKNLEDLNSNEEKIDEKDKLFLNKIILLEKQEKEVKKEGQKKRANIISQHEVLQKTLLKEMLVKQIHLFLPLKYLIFGEKFIKLVKIYEDDSLSVIISKVDENLKKIKNYMNIISKKRIKLVIKFYEIYKKVKNYVDNFQQLFSESFKL